ncbi:MAG: hypothetical protein ACREIW_13885 [Chthoniobacterales bacterium]
MNGGFWHREKSYVDPGNIDINGTPMRIYMLGIDLQTSAIGLWRYSW